MRCIPNAAKLVLLLSATTFGAFVASSVSTADILVTSQGNSGHVLRFDAVTGAFLGSFLPNARDLRSPSDMTFGPTGDLYVVNNSTADWILRFQGTTGEYLGLAVPYLSSSQTQFTGMTFGPDGNIYVGSGSQGQILRFSSSTGALLDTFVTTAAGGLDFPNHLGFGPDGNLYVCSSRNNVVAKFDGHTGQRIGGFSVAWPVGITFRDGFAFVTGNGDGVIRIDIAASTASTFIGSGAPSNVGKFAGLRFGCDGKLYVCDDYDNSIVRFDGTTGAFIDVLVPRLSGGLVHPNEILFTEQNPTSVPSVTWGTLKARYR